MSEITANLFQFSKRANTLNVNQEEMPDFNSKIQLISERYNERFENVKELFKFLIDFAINETDFTENQPGIELKEGEIVVQESTISELKGKIQELESLEQARFEKELTESEAMENVLLVPVTPDQKELLIGIAKNRLEMDYATDVPGVPDTPDSIIRKIAFRESYLYNEYKRFYTGL